MTVSNADRLPRRFSVGMFPGPPRLRPLMPLLRRLPPALSRHLLAILSVCDGLVRFARFRRTLAWAALQGASGWTRWQLAVAVLANHGRFVADEAAIGVANSDDLCKGTVIEGAEYLSAASEGAILLGFHLGPPRTWLVLRELGYPVRIAGRLEAARGNPAWREAFEMQEAVRLPAGDTVGRLSGLYRIRKLLLDGALVYITADGPFGREAFRIELPGGLLVVRIGWLALRRQTRVPVLPLLVHRDRGRRVIVVHPPLPDPDEDPERDAARCKAALAPLIEAYVRRYPDQCRYVALPRWPTARPWPSSRLS